MIACSRAKTRRALRAPARGSVSASQKATSPWSPGHHRRSDGFGRSSLLAGPSDLGGASLWRPSHADLLGKAAGTAGEVAHVPPGFMPLPAGPSLHRRRQLGRLREPSLPEPQQRVRGGGPIPGGSHLIHECSGRSSSVPPPTSRTRPDDIRSIDEKHRSSLTSLPEGDSGRWSVQPRPGGRALTGLSHRTNGGTWDGRGKHQTSLPNRLNSIANDVFTAR